MSLTVCGNLALTLDQSKEIKRTRLIDISDYIRLYGASDKLFHLRSRGRSHSSDASQRKKEDPGMTNLLVPHRERCLGTRGGV
ncbi:hypothetical protein TNCV_66341 [Trichonephila clavipes]|nr:hypothetical protein TNCV_66341 [Trichonephila clavipes]